MMAIHDAEKLIFIFSAIPSVSDLNQSKLLTKFPIFFLRNWYFIFNGYSLQSLTARV